jgi:hypothetical protein
MLQLFSRTEFERAVVEHRAERHARGFSCWASLWPCCSVTWAGRSRCARFAAGWRPAKASCGIWGCQTRPKNKLLSFDATLIELCATVFDWAQYRRTKGAVKLHLLLDHQGLLPSYAVVTQGRVHESRVARRLRFEPRHDCGF